MKRIIGALMVLLLSACASNPPEIRNYLLAEPDFEPANSELTIEAVLGTIRLADFISGTGLAVEAGNREVTTTRQHRWAERLEGQLERQLRQGMSELFPRAQWVPLVNASSIKNRKYRLDLYVDAFHITPTNNVRVRVQWFLRDIPQQQLQTGVFDITEPLQGTGYGNAVVALSSAWHQVLMSISEQVQAAAQAE